VPNPSDPVTGKATLPAAPTDNRADPWEARKSTARQGWEEDLANRWEAAPTSITKRGDRKPRWILFAVVGAGIFLLSVCPVVGIVGYLFLYQGGQPQQVIVGKWTVDVEESFKTRPGNQRQNAAMGGALMPVFEFKANNTWSVSLNGMACGSGKWKMVNVQGSTAVLEMTDSTSGQTYQWTITVINRDSIRVVEQSFPGGIDHPMVLKRR
jgi:hypothetical protein